MVIFSAIFLVEILSVTSEKGLDKNITLATYVNLCRCRNIDDRSYSVSWTTKSHISTLIYVISLCGLVFQRPCGYLYLWFRSLEDFFNRFTWIEMIHEFMRGNWGFLITIIVEMMLFKTGEVCIYEESILERDFLQHDFWIVVLSLYFWIVFFIRSQVSLFLRC